MADENEQAAAPEGAGPALVDWESAAVLSKRQVEQVSELLMMLRPAADCVANWRILAALEHAHAALLEATVALCEAFARERARGGRA